MRFRRLELTAFGPFTDRALDLSAGFHLLLGPNEAGKSTTLRALTGFLFGIPARTTDAHVHEMKNLRIGAELSGPGADPVVLIRRKGTKNTLLDESGEPVPEETLARLLGGVGEDLYANVFALDHERLRHGGRELVAGGGDLAESLFGAGLGRSVAAVLRGLESEADGIYRPRASNPPLNEALRGFKEAKKKVRAAMLKPADWQERRLRLEEMEAKAGSGREQVRALAGEARDLERRLELIPLFRGLATFRAEREALGEVVLLDHDAPARRKEAQRVLTEAGPRLERLERDIGKLEEENEALVVPEDLLALKAEIGELRDDLGAHRKAVSDRDGRLRSRRTAHLGRAADALRRLGRDPGAEGADLSEVKGLLVEAARERRVRELAGERRKLDEARRLLRDRHTDLRVRRERAVERAGRLSEALGRSVPPDETLLRCEQEAAELEKRREKIDAAEERLTSELGKTGKELDRLEGDDAPPTEDALTEARGRRKEEWVRVRKSWLDGSEAEAPEVIAGRFEITIEEADRIVDHMRRDADRVARRAALTHDLRSARESQSEAQEERRALEEERTRQDAEWRALWTSLGFEPLPPAEMRSWLRSVRELDDRVGEIDDQIAKAKADLESSENEWEEWRGHWRGEMTAIGLPEDAAPEEAEAVLEALADLAGALDGAAEVEGRIASIDRDAEAFTERVSRVVAACATDLEDRPAEEAVIELEQRLHAGTLDRERREGLQKRLADKRETRDDLVERREVARSTLDQLTDAADVEEASDLPAKEAASERAREIDAEIVGLMDQIRRWAAGADIDALAEELADVDEQALGDRLEDVGRRREDLVTELAEVERIRGGLEKELALLDGESEAAAAADLAEEHLAAIRRHVESWALLRLGAHVLGREVERYRREHQGPLLTRAGEVFSRMTLGSYTGLEVDLDDRQLLCIRKDGTPVGGTGLSEGTADQLYLALRIAAVERHVTANDPVPFVADDIFVNFDDDRARAGLEILGELAERTQVLFFTHHSRLRELAEEALGERCRVHQV